MAKLTALTRILREAIPEAPAWVDKLIEPINRFFDVHQNALQGNLTLVDNVQAQTKDVTFTTLSTYTTGPGSANWDTIKIARTLKSKAKHLLITYCEQVESEWTPMSTAVTPQWRESDGEIQVAYIAGLANSKKYTIRFLILP